MLEGIIVVPGGAAYGSFCCAEDTGTFEADDAAPLAPIAAPAILVAPPPPAEALSSADSPAEPGLPGAGGGTMTVSEVSVPDPVAALGPEAVAELELAVDEALAVAAAPEPAVAAEVLEAEVLEAEVPDVEGLVVAESLGDEAAVSADALVAAALAEAQ